MYIEQSKCSKKLIVLQSDNDPQEVTGVQYSPFIPCLETQLVVKLFALLHYLYLVVAEDKCDSTIPCGMWLKFQQFVISVIWVLNEVTDY